MFPAKKKLNFSLRWESSVVVSASLFLSLAATAVDLDQVVAPVVLEALAALVDVVAPAAGFRRMMMMRSFVMENLEPS